MGVSPASMRSRVVLPAPLRPDSVSRSPRSTLKETPRSRGLPATSFPSPDAIATATERDGRAASLRDAILAPMGERNLGVVAQWTEAIRRGDLAEELWDADLTRERAP